MCSIDGVRGQAHGMAKSVRECRIGDEVPQKAFRRLAASHDIVEEFPVRTMIM
ncbi:hypothetical protein ACFUJ0_17565 [Streptomyces sp. NPDC057242]|uniref:hypothetical protein n=1 Tax=unclassified Streptomyces TaxID=2593676 RepID=UPI003634593C